MNSTLVTRILSRSIALGITLTSVSCFSGLGYWQQAYFGAPQQQYGPPQQQQGGGGRWNTDNAPGGPGMNNGNRYGYGSQPQGYYQDPNGTQFRNQSTPPSGSSSKPKVKTKETAATLHKPKQKTTTTTTTTTKIESKPKPASDSGDVPYGTKVHGKTGFVYSPYAKEKGMVDVIGIPAGTKVECPYSQKHFRVP